MGAKPRSDIGQQFQFKTRTRAKHIMCTEHVTGYGSVPFAPSVPTYTL
jgi:hypothetical protein